MNRILLLGDSITAGVTNGFPSSIFTTKIRQALNMGDIDIINRGVPGDDTNKALLRLETDVLSANPDTVVVFFGTNDAHNAEITPEQFKNNLNTIINSIGRKKIILVTPGISSPDMQSKYPNEVLSQYAQVIKEVAQSQDIKLVDWHNIASQQNSSDILQDDGLHYTAYAYDLLVKQLAPLIKLNHHSSLLNTQL